MLGVSLAGRTRFFQLLHLKAGDLQFLLRGTKEPSGITLIVIDQKSLDTFREPLLFWHPYYAEAIRAAADGGAKVFGLDVEFAIPVDRWAPDHDRLLWQAAYEAAGRMPVICGYVPSTLSRQGEWPVQLNMWASAVGLAGLLNLRVDADDFVRSVELAEAPQASEPSAQSLALRMAEKLGATGSAAGRIMTINYRGPAGVFPRVSLCDFLAAARAGRKEELRQWVAGRAVLLGKDTIDDRHATPFYTLAPGTRQANTAGVEIHANALATLLDRDYLLPVPPWVRWAALGLAALATALASGYLRARHVAVVMAASAAGIIVTTQALFRSGRVLPASEIALAGFSALALTFIHRSLTAEKRGAIFRRAVALFAGGKVARTLDETEALPASGSRQMVTILFSDIRGFTAFCEEKDPAAVVELLNEYLRAMVAIIVRHRGNANKFIGDGIMAIFSDEDGSTPGDHASRAVRCGLEMAHAPGRFRTGVGIHSGVALVGCVGSPDKMDFTALGDTVNLASRLEGLNKQYNTQVLMSETTRQMLEPGIDTFCLGEVEIRGRTALMKLYTPAEPQPALQATMATSKQS